MDDSDTLSYDDIFSSAAHERTVTDLRWTKAGDLSFLWSPQGDDKSLWTVRADSEDIEELIPSSKLGDEGDRWSLDDYQWWPDGGSILLHDGPRLARFVVAGATLETLLEADADIEDPKIAPDGARIAYVRGANLYVLDVESRRELPLTTAGDDDTRLFGKTDWVYWEELWHRDSTGFWWSPDGKRLALYSFSEEEVERVPLMDAMPTYPTVRWQRYPKAGKTNPRVAIGVVDATGGKPRWLDEVDSASGYLPRATWIEDGAALLVQRINRDQDRIELRRCRIAGGRCEVVLVEAAASWVDVSDDFHAFADGRFLWTSDRDGWRRLYLYPQLSKGAAGRRVSPTDLAIGALDAVYEDEGIAIVTAFSTEGLGASERQVWAIDLASGNAEPLADVPGWNTADAGPAARWVHTASDTDAGPRRTLRSRAGDLDLELPHHDASYDRAKLPQWDFATLPGPDGVALPYRILRPRGFDAKQKYPVIMYHYGGPASQVVSNSSSSNPSRDLWHVRQAQRGYVVIQVDNPASVFFGKEGAARLHRRFGELELASQLAAVEWLRSRPWVDGERIGLWGWSGGGANTLYSLLHAPGTWAAGVAGAPVTDWHLYDTIWTERYLDHPDDNAQGYLDSSAIESADRLQDPLLIIHGTGDDNVHAQNTLVFSQRLIDAGLPFEQAFYPGQKHGFRDSAAPHVYQRIETFFDRYLRDR